MEEVLSHPPRFHFVRQFAACSAKQVAALRLFAMEVALDDQFLHGGAQVRNLAKVNRSSRRKCGEHLFGRAVRRPNLIKDASGPMRLSMDQFRDDPLPDTG